MSENKKPKKAIMSKNKKTFLSRGQRVALLRKKIGLTQKQLGFSIGISGSNISLIERDAAKPCADTVEALADLFNVPLELFRTQIRYNVDQILKSVSDNPIKHVPVVGSIDDTESWQISKDRNYSEWYPIHKQYSDRSVGLYVTGGAMINENSNDDSYPAGTIIVIDPDQKAIDASLVVAINKKTKQGLFRRLIKDDDKRYLCPNNSDYTTIDITNNSDINIFAPVIYRVISNKAS